MDQRQPATAETAAVAATTTKTAAVAMATSTASDEGEGDGNGDGNGDGGGCLGVFDDVRYGKVRYIGALHTAHYALTTPAPGKSAFTTMDRLRPLWRKRFAPAPGKTTFLKSFSV
jgi:hypothetical protein